MNDCALPFYIPEKELEDWLNHRRAIGKPVPPASLPKVIAKLARIREAGHDPLASLEASIVGGYQGLFPVPSIPNGKHGKPTEGNPPSHQPAPTITPAQQAHADQMMADGYRKIEQARLKRLEEKAAQ